MVQVRNLDVDSNLQRAASLTTNRAVYDRLLACLGFRLAALFFNRYSNATTG